MRIAAIARNLYVPLILGGLQVQSISGQQSITSAGDHNVNINGQKSTAVIVQPTINETSKTYIQNRLVQIQKDPSLWEGYLLPGKGKADLSTCFPGADQPDLEALLGSNLIIEVGSSLFLCPARSCSIVSTQTEDLVAVQMDKGVLSVSAKVLNSEGYVVVKLERNHFFVNWNQVDRRPIRTKSGLVVFDQKDNKVLQVDFVNPHTNSVIGIFFNPGVGRLEITPDAITTPNNNRIQKLCAVGAKMPSNSGRPRAAVSVGGFFFGGPSKSGQTPILGR